MSTLPKLLASVTIDTSNQTFAFGLGGAQTVDITAATYDTILEVLANLEDALQAVDATFSVTCSSGGIVVISCDNSWTITWASTDDDLESLLGFEGTESVAGSGPYTLTASNRHLRGFYSPVGGQWPSDRRTIKSREQETDAGGLYQLASSTVHRYRDVTFALLSEKQLVTGGTDSDGAGGSVKWTSRTLYDFWTYTRDRPFRFYEDATDGTVASPGTEVNTYDTCRRFNDDWAPDMPDPGDYSFFNVTMKLKVTGAQE
jgi:hypothetical protein